MFDRKVARTAVLAVIMGIAMASSAAARQGPHTTASDEADEMTEPPDGEMQLPALEFAIVLSQASWLVAPPPTFTVPSLTLPSLPSTALVAPVQPRPAAMFPLYVSYAAMQVLDVQSTLRGLSSGAREMNPLLCLGGSSPFVMIAAKAASFAATVYLAERLAKTNRVAAVILMASLNSAYAVIIAHNHSVASR
jgi:uncharacterized protein DUF5658